MKKRLLSIIWMVLVLGMMVTVFSAEKVAAHGPKQQPIQRLLGYSWDPSVGSLNQPIGNVLYALSDHRHGIEGKFIFQGAQPLTSYTVGFDIFGAARCGSSPAAFGVPRDVCADGTVGGVTASAGVYRIGTLTTKANGHGSLGVNLKHLPSGTYNIVFWAIPCAPPTACGYFPQASTGSWGNGPFETIVIP
jgi:hypothetical protein